MDEIQSMDINVSRMERFMSNVQKDMEEDGLTTLEMILAFAAIIGSIPNYESYNTVKTDI